MAELLARAVDLSLEEAIVRTVGRLEALTEIAVPTRTRFTGDYPIRVPDAVGPDVTPRRPRPNRRLFRC